MELILSTTRELIGERGNDAVSMREIAAGAGVPISSVYQYFPDKGALLMAIMEDYYDRIHHTLGEAIKDVRDVDGLIRVVPEILKTFAEFFRRDPALANIWAGIQADPRLVDQDAADSYRNAELFSNALLPLVPGLRKSDIKAFALFFTHTTGGIIRFSLLVDEKDGRALLKEAATLVELRIRNLVEIAAARVK